MATQLTHRPKRTPLPRQVLIPAESEPHPSTVHNLKVAKRLGIKDPMARNGNPYDARTNCELIKFPFTYSRESKTNWVILNGAKTVQEVETHDQEKVAGIVNEMNREFARALGFIVHHSY